MFDDLKKTLAKGPVKYTMYAQLANPGDPTNDGSIVWPSDRKRVELGTLSLTKLVANSDSVQKTLAFNPIILTNGITLSDDPLPLDSLIGVRALGGTPALAAGDRITARARHST